MQNNRTCGLGLQIDLIGLEILSPWRTDLVLVKGRKDWGALTSEGLRVWT